MLLLAIAAAAQMSPAQPVSNIPVFSADDMPAYVQQSGETRKVLLRVIVRPDSTIRACEIELSSGDAKLDRYTCMLVMKRAQLMAAHWPDGSSAFGVIRLPVAWVVGSPPPRKSIEGDLNLTVRGLPKGVRSRTFQRVIIAVDEVGHIVACDGDNNWSPGMDRNHPQLLKVACEQLTQKFSPIPPKDDTGRPVRSVQNATVRFDK